MVLLIAFVVMYLRIRLRVLVSVSLRFGAVFPNLLR
jgi:hypothetical protein